MLTPTLTLKHKITKEIVTGPFRSLCNRDKRIWKQIKEHKPSEKWVPVQGKLGKYEIKVK